MSRAAAQLLLGLAAFVLLAWGLGELWLSLLGSADLTAVQEVAELRSPALTDAARVITWAGSTAVLIPLALIVCVLLERRGLRGEALAVALTLGGAMLIWRCGKLLVARPRPPVVHLQAVSGASMPSGHATQASAFWLSLVLSLSAAGAQTAATRLAMALALLLILAVAASRVYLGVHYPGDVLIGALLGSSWAAFVARCLREAQAR